MGFSTTGAGHQAITLAHVADRAGFSRSTASLVFQNSPLVADATRAKVLAAARELGYVYNRAAAGLRTLKSNTIGLLITELNNPFFAGLVAAVEEELAPAGYTVLLGTTLDDPDRQEMFIRTLLEYRIDGLLVVPALGSTPDFTKPLEVLQVPHVLLTREVDGLATSYVGSDNHKGGRIAAEHLLEHGCRDIAYVGGRAVGHSRRNRLRGVQEVVEGVGLELNSRWTVEAGISSAEGYTEAERLLKEGPAPEGIICHSDAIAFGVMRALQESGVAVGREVRVTGFDDLVDAANWSPSLTSVAVATRQIGQDASRLLIDQLRGRAGEAPRSIVFDPILRPRESCGHWARA